MLLGVFLGLVAFDYLITVEDCLSTNNAGVILANIAPEASNHFFQTGLGKIILQYIFGHILLK
jgi:hypothetical protein